MAKTTMLVSDKSGALIESNPHKVTIGNGKNVWTADVTAGEAAELVAALNARAAKKRGRPPKTQEAPETG